MFRGFFFQLKSYFNYHKKERNGIFIIILLILIILIVQQFIPYFFPQKDFDYSSYQKQIEAWKKQVEENKQKQKIKPELFYFDPNSLDSLGFLKLGLSKWQTKTILNYRRKHGQFRRKQDFGKMYGIDDSLYQILSPYIRISKKQKALHPKNEDYPKNKISHFTFDPNTASFDSLQMLGFSNKTAAQIVSYRNKGGHFYKNEQLLKIYDMDSEQYHRVEKYIQIKTPKNKKRGQVKDTTHQPPKIKVKLNTADTLDLQQLYGIGPAFARRIVKYRNKLGGFYRKEQLKEVWGMDDERYQKIEDYCIVDPSKIKKIDINTATIKQLNKHPYIDFSIAKRIILLRKKKGGRFNSIEELKEIDMLYDELFQKIKPFLSL